MKTLKYIIIVFFTSIPLIVSSQPNYKVKGRVIDEISKEPLIGASILFDSLQNGVVSNEFGYFLFESNIKHQRIKALYLGYIPLELALNLTRDTLINLSLSPSIIQAEQVTIRANNAKQFISGVQTGTVAISRKEVKKLPTLFGESDFIKMVTLNPGIKTGSDADMGFYVRGGGADQNLVRLDNTTIYNPSHVLGIFSVFNSDVIKSAKLIKSGMPANYGGRLSSIVDVNTRKGSFTNFGIEGSFGLISSKATVQGPLLKDRLSIILSYRRSYIDEIFKPLVKTIYDIKGVFYNNTRYYFSDATGKICFNVNQKNKLELGHYHGKDNFSLFGLNSNFENEMSWGNRLFSLNWKRRFNGNWSSNYHSGYSKYKYQLDASQNGVSLQINSEIEEISTSIDFLNAKTDGQIIKFGINYSFYSFSPNNIEASNFGTKLEYGNNRLLQSQQMALYYNHEFNFNAKFKANLGLRYSGYSQMGPFTEIMYNASDLPTDTVFHERGKLIKLYHAPEPRISLRYRLNKNSSLKGSATLNYQYNHLLSSSAVTLPTDVWLPSSKVIAPQKSTQYSMGYFFNLEDNQYQNSINIYYKQYYNQVELLQGLISNYTDDSFEQSTTFGRGNSYGIELYSQKKYGNLAGWIAYTLSWTNRKFAEINLGKVYPAKYDRRHDINVTFNYELSERLSGSALFILSSGNAYTLPEYKYLISGNLTNGYGNKNSFRMPIYHRLDFSLKYILAINKKHESALILSLFNVYNRSNPFYIYFEASGNINDYNLKVTPRQLTVLPFIPSVSWNYKF